MVPYRQEQERKTFGPDELSQQMWRKEDGVGVNLGKDGAVKINKTVNSPLYPGQYLRIEGHLIEDDDNSDDDFGHWQWSWTAEAIGLNLR